MSEENRTRSATPRFREVVGSDVEGNKIVKTVPEHVVVAWARPGMAIVDHVADETGVILAMTEQLCLYQASDGAHHAATWHTITLQCVQPDLGTSQMDERMK